MFDIYFVFFARLFKAWQRGAKWPRRFIALGVSILFVAGIFAGLSEIDLRFVSIDKSLAAGLAVFGALILLAVSAQEQLQEVEKSQEKIEQKEEQVRANPEKPQLAWDLAGAS